ncbi:MAG TPA: phospholipase D family protein [Candidatus Binatia bacterium]|nr:phospholipase D family protein [Candidatus Binatia bacterium]
MRNRAREFAICFCLLFWWAIASGAEMAVQACFSPQGRCSAHIIREIEKAQKELLIAVYAFTNDDLARVVAQAKKRGVSVQIVLDREFDAGNEKSQGKFLEEQKIPVRRISGMKPVVPEREPGLMHQKFSVIDRKIVFTGSYNWTRSADHSNDENLLLFRNAGPLAEEYRKVFFQLWERQG